MAKRWRWKDPSDILDYEWDWSGFVSQLDPEDVIVQVYTPVVVSDVTAVVIDDHDFIPDTMKTRTWISGGTVGDNTITLKVRTQGGRTLEETALLEVRER